MGGGQGILLGSFREDWGGVAHRLLGSIGLCVDVCVVCVCVCVCVCVRVCVCVCVSVCVCVCVFV